LRLTVSICVKYQARLYNFGAATLIKRKKMQKCDTTYKYLIVLSLKNYSRTLVLSTGMDFCSTDVPNRECVSEKLNKTEFSQNFFSRITVNLFTQ
jgi:hypothetical protein